MITDNTVEIRAPASRVWDVYTDVERWSEWTTSIERIVPLDGPRLEIGGRFRIKQPRFPELVWEVTELERGRSWTWRNRSLGGLTLAIHEVTPLDRDRTFVRQRLDQRRPVAVAVGVVMRRRTRLYLDLEARGLKARCESNDARTHD